MNNSGDAAEQVVRITIDGIEVAAKITGAAVKNIAAMLYTVYKNRDTSKVSSKGREKLNSMLKSGRPLEVFTVSREHFRTFAQQAKSYGVSYCAMKNKGDKDGGTALKKEKRKKTPIRPEPKKTVGPGISQRSMKNISKPSVKKELESIREQRSGGAGSIRVKEKNIKER